MSWRYYLLLGIIGFACVLIVSVFQDSPGYMDAEYYFAGGIRLARGYGFTEEVLWNYLDDPIGLPHPSHAYWMPLTSILAAAGMAVTGLYQFSVARVVFMLLAAVVPPLTSYLSFRFNGRRDMAMMSGWLAVFSVFYLAYLPTTDVFGVYMILGALSISIYAKWGKNKELSMSRRLYYAFLLGLLAGMMHLARADGITWLFILILVVVSRWFKSDHRRESFRIYMVCIVFSLLGYLVIMGPWMLRNLTVFGKPVSPGGIRALWINNYDELYIYPGALLTPVRWWESGLRDILNARVWAMGQNLQTTLAVQGEIFLAPLILLGVWRLRHSLSVRVGLAAWLLSYITMTMIFPFQGARGGFFHAGSAVQPMLWATVPLGLEVILEWGNRWRNWDILQARRFFQVGLILLAILLTVLIAYSRILGSGDQTAWDANQYRYTQLEKVILAYGASPEDIVMVNNSPGYFIASGRPSLSIPYGDLQTVLDVADRYRARYLLLEIDQLQGKDDLFDNPGDRPGLQYLGIYKETRIFEFVESEK